MTRITVEFVTSAARIEQLPADNLPEIALAGRSNVGKSSLINSLLRVRGLARTSRTPGRTQLLNYFRILPGDGGKPFYFVDMPGYGYSTVSKGMRERWAQLIDEYLSTRKTLRGVIQIVDLRHPPQPLDLSMAEWLLHHRHHFLVVGTKADKVAKTKVEAHLATIAADLGLAPADVVAYSSESGLGREAVWRWVLDAVR